MFGNEIYFKLQVGTGPQQSFTLHSAIGLGV